MQPGKGGAQLEGAEGADIDDQRHLYEHQLGELAALVASRVTTDELATLFDTVTKARNDVLHAGFRHEPAKAEQLVERIKQRIGEASALIENVSKKHASGCRGVFVNISNHESIKWSKEQMEASCVLGEPIVDIPFPSIPPDESVQEVAHLADTFSQKVVELNPSAVHVAGEFTFTFASVKRLQ